MHQFRDPRDRTDLNRIAHSSSTPPLPPARPSLSQALLPLPVTTSSSSLADPRLAPTEVLTTTKPVAMFQDAAAVDSRAADPVAREVDVEEASPTADVAGLLVDVAGPRPPMREFFLRHRGLDYCPHFLTSGVAITGHHLIKILKKVLRGVFGSSARTVGGVWWCLILLNWRIPGILHRGKNSPCSFFLIFIA